MKRFVCLILVLLSSATALAQESTDQETEAFVGFSSYYQRILLSKDSTAKITITASLSRIDDKEIVVPLNYSGKIVDMTMTEGNAEVEVTKRGAAYFAVIRSDDTLLSTVSLAFTAPEYLSWKDAGPKNYGNYLLKYEFVNSSSFPVADFTGEIVLTNDFVVHNIVSSIPVVSKNDPDTPYHIREHEGLHSIIINGKNLGFGENAAVTFNIRRESKSPLIAVAMLLAAVLYLVFFRDVLDQKVTGG